MRVVHRRRDPLGGIGVTAAVGPFTDRTVDLEITGDDTTAAHLAAALDPRPVVPRPGLIVDGCWSSPDTPVDQLDLRNGSLLEPSPTPPDPTPTPARSLAIVGGIAAGVAVDVPDRSFTVGRGVECDVVLDDPTVSRAAVAVPAAADDGITTCGTTQWTVRPTIDDRPHAIREGLGRRGGLLPFNRPPRVAPSMDTEPLPVPAAVEPPAPVEPPSIAAIVLPVIAGGVMAMLFSPMFAIFTALGPVLAIGTWWERRRTSRRAHRRALRELADAVGALAASLPARVAEERARRRELVPDIAEVVRRARVGSVRLWERRADDPDAFLCGVGTTRLPFRPEVIVDDGEPAEEADAALVAAPPLTDVPLEVALGPGMIVGVVGPAAARQAIGRSLLVQLATHHGPADVAVLVAAEAADAGAWAWTSLLPHAIDPISGSLPSGAFDHADTVAVDGRLAVGASSLLVVLVDGDTAFEGRNTIGRRAVVADGTAVIALVDDPHRLPAGCGAVVTVDEFGRVEMVDPRQAVAADRGLAWGISTDTATEAARGLAQFDDPDLVRAGAGIPDGVSLLDLLGVTGDDPDEITARWSMLRGSADLVAPIGADDAGALDLDLVGDGPHLLVGGTTGAGKSELLRSMVASFAASADPDHLAFVLIDYKGGAAFDCCADLPHVAGLVTDLDADLAARALQCLEAELHTRELRLREVGADSLAAYRERTRGRVDLEPLPRLMIVIDEFASMAADLPDFLQALVGIAQRGRSLGVHLVLATQRPGGVITDDIKANTNCRIALRVTDPHESADVIGAPVAADIPRSRPGRAHARFGPGELVGFQSALVTGRTSALDRVRVRPVGSAALRGPAPTGATDLERLVATMLVAHGDRSRPRSPWPDPLPSSGAATDDGWWLVDRPAEQRQQHEGWTPTDGHLVVVGGPGQGASTTLAGAAFTAIDAGWHVYGIDGDAGLLHGLEALPAVGAIAGPVDSERRVRILRWLADEVARRRGAPGDHTPIALVVDDLGSLVRHHDQVKQPEPHQALASIWADGPAVGVVVVASLRRSGDLPSALAAGAGTVLVHQLLDQNDAARFGLRQLPEAMPPGRAVRVGDGAQLQVLIHDGSVQAAVAARLGASPTSLPRPIGTLAAEIPLTALGSAPVAVDDRGTLTMPLGLASRDLDVAELRLPPQTHALVTGPPRSGRTATLELVARLAPAFVVVGAGSELAARLGVDGVEPVDLPADLAGTVVLVDDVEGVDDLTGRLHQLATNPPAGVHIVAATRPDRFRNAYGHWSHELKASRTGVLLQPEPLDGDLVGTMLPGRLDLPARPGSALLVNEGQAAAVQVAWVEA